MIQLIHLVYVLLAAAVAAAPPPATVAAGGRAAAQKAAAVLFVLPSRARVSSFYPSRRQSDALLDLSGQEIGSLVA